VIIETARWIESAARFCFGGAADSDTRRGVESRFRRSFITVVAGIRPARVSDRGYNSSGRRSETLALHCKNGRAESPGAVLNKREDSVVY
jgi:hypothetical protein